MVVQTKLQLQSSPGKNNVIQSVEKVTVNISGSSKIASHKHQALYFSKLVPHVYLKLIYLGPSFHVKKNHHY